MKEIAKLHRRRYREDAGQFLVEGVRSVESAILANAPLIEVVVGNQAVDSERLSDVLRRVDAPVLSASASEFARIADTRATQGVVAVARLRRADAATLRGPIVMLDAVQDPGNVGAVIRAAAWFGVAAVVTAPGTADPFGPKAARATMGGLWDVAIAETGDPARTLSDFRSRGLALYGADLDGVDAARWKPGRDAVLVLGSEAHGISDAVQELLDGRVRITGSNRVRGVESLNAAVAAGILLHRWLG